jgi:hypothetical protein
MKAIVIKNATDEPEDRTEEKQRMFGPGRRPDRIDRVVGAVAALMPEALLPLK